MVRQVSCPSCDVHAESVFRVEGMDCHEEVALIERRLERVPGVHAVAADVVSQRLRVAHDLSQASASRIAEAVADTGMRAWLDQGDAAPAAAAPGTSHRLVVTIASGLLLLTGVSAQAFGMPRPLAIGAFAGAILTGGFYTARRAVAAIRARSLDINVLMTIAVAGAVVLGEWLEAVTVVFLFAVAQWLEARSMERARRAIRALIDTAPNEVTVRRAGVDVRVDTGEVTAGDVFVVRPGERIALDGEVVDGDSDVNQAPVTGESMPVPKQPGDVVYAGSINGHGAIEVRATRPARDSTIARIIHLVERAQAQRAPTQAFVDRFAGVYTPVVIVLAALVAIVPPLALGQPFETWFYRALVLLVIACPCAFVISTPVSVVSALTAAAHHGVLIKGGVHLERTAAVQAVAFDKTGTLTRGVLEVRDVVPLDGASASTVLSVAASISARSEHPIGHAIARHAGREGVSHVVAEGYRVLPGRGAEATLNGESLVMGSHRLFEERQLCVPDAHDHLDAFAARGQSAVLVAAGRSAVGIVGVADEVRASGRAAVADLKRLGIAHVVMLTGDARPTAEAIASQVGVDEVRADLLPEDKVAAVTDLRQRYGPVAMVGDGVNDAPALAVADVGFAMGAAASDVALETADVALMSDDLNKVPWAIRLSRAAVRNIRANIAFSLGVKAVFLVLGLSGSATLWMAVVADMGASLVVVGNALRLLRTR